MALYAGIIIVTLGIFLNSLIEYIDFFSAGENAHKRKLRKLYESIRIAIVVGF
jgi:hypothetical protein